MNPQNLQQKIQHLFQQVSSLPIEVKVPTLSSSQLAHMIDHTLLKPEATTSQIERLCNEAKQFSFASVCVNPSYIPLCAKILNNTSVKVCTVIGFPLGATLTSIKKYETEQAIKNGATEIDMVINIGQLKSGEYEYVQNDIAEVVQAAKSYNIITKVIIETSLLTEEEKIAACLLTKEAKADFVKTSTGFNGGGATEKDITLIKYVVGNTMSVKASGGIRNRETALKLIACGAKRLGTSAGIAIVNDAPTSQGGY